PAHAVAREQLRRMTSVLSHRGPDDDGFYVHGALGLGHRRLSIIDVEGSRQPILSLDKTKAIVFNGEIYNFKTVRDTLLQRGHHFTTQGDTEVILRAYEEYGEACVQHLRGMFAFAIWDGVKKQLFLARDRVGIKPLYYYWDGQKFLFASEIKAILQDPSVEKTLDPQALDDYLTYLYIPGPKTIFQKIRKLRPGYTLTVSARGVVEREYWDLDFEPKDGLQEADYAMGLLEKLRETVAIHLMSEVPLGAFLSGGVDSSAVVGVMAGLLNQPVNTASIGFREADFDELPYAREVAQRFQTRAHERTVVADAAKILDALVWHFDEPFADSSMVPTYYVSQVAREHVTVCLSGDGGDENFAGYRRYRFDVFENRLRTILPAKLRRSLFGTLGYLYPKVDWLPRIFRGKTLLTNLSLSPERAYYQTMSWFTPAMKSLLYRESLKRALHDYDAFSVLQPYFDRSQGWDALSRIQYVDIKTYLVDDILTKVDRASMAHSLEVRVPLLDHEVMEYAACIPAAYKLRHGEGKYIFKKSLGGLLPSSILYRSKMGFSIPLAQWFRGDLKSTFEERILAKDAYVGNFYNLDVIRRWWEHHQRGMRDYAPYLWALLMLECWCQRFMR
ncbi:MAG TPA: asparagine synthase (glutamine-hydrolyzing), partial [Candidatus Saccharimonadia bacterium]|nr:asparagine synthase (glutamine-hydrolyzing) [Candidatus Saccharimonadia bacterium]